MTQTYIFETGLTAPYLYARKKGRYQFYRFAEAIEPMEDVGENWVTVGCWYPTTTIPPGEWEAFTADPLAYIAEKALE